MFVRFIVGELVDFLCT